MPTETANRKATLSILEKLRQPAASNRRNDWTGEELPPEEEEAQMNFEEQQGARVTQSLVNQGGTDDLTGMGTAAQVGMTPGPTGMSPPGVPNAGMVPYSPEEFERRNSFTPTEKMQMPAKRKRNKAEEEMEEEEPADVPVPVSGGY